MKHGTFHGLLCAAATGLVLALFAGRAVADEIILYDGRDFGSPSITLNQSTPDLGNFDNEASSVRVISGAWVLYRNADYGVTPNRPSLTLGPGDYPNLDDVGFPRNRLSSVRLLEDDVIQPPPIDCPAPYQAVGQGGQCVWTCAGGTRPGPGGECVCQPGLFESGTDNAGRRVCGPGQVAPPPTIPPVTRPAPPTGGFQTCNAPYRIALPRNGQVVCLWACAAGTVPDEASGECVCAPGMVEAGTDNAGRRTCEAQPAADEIYWVGGDEAIAMAQLNGFTFRGFAQGFLSGANIYSWCEMRGATFIAHFRPGMGMGVTIVSVCDVTLFRGRELAEGWSFGRFEWIRPPNINFRFDELRGPGFSLTFRPKSQFQSPTVTLETLSLHGPAGRDWTEAFR